MFMLTQLQKSILVRPFLNFYFKNKNLNRLKITFPEIKVHVKFVILF